MKARVTRVCKSNFREDTVKLKQQRKEQRKQERKGGYTFGDHQRFFKQTTNKGFSVVGFALELLLASEIKMNVHITKQTVVL